ncbi:MAG: MBOAT family protein [Lachnospiraceae bacterium]|nr:MBOAT family protein [Lachnospiraceae bacterium]
MLFQSLSFAVFLPVVFALYWGLPDRCRPWILLVAGYVFYAFAGPPYLLLLIFVTMVSRFAGHVLAERKREKSGGILALSVVLILAPLAVYKALGFFNTGIPVPVGLSFYSFQAVGYLIDVRRGKVKPAGTLREHMLFLSFFPQLLAGPIARGDRLLPQLTDLPAFSCPMAAIGIRRIFWGLFKKLVLADVLAYNANIVFSDPSRYRGAALLLAALMFSLEIYCDFSAYSDMALGVAALFGIRLEENFRQPYFADSVRDFWSRWHISLSTWFRDYVYIPMGGNRKGVCRRDVNLFVTFFLSGLWHGSGVTFLVWGILHALLQIAERHLEALHRLAAGPFLRRFMRMIRTIIVFLLVTSAWVFFRAKTLSDACMFFTHGLDGILSPAAYLKEGVSVFHDKTALILSCILLIGVDLLSLKEDFFEWLERRPPALRLGGTVAFLLLFWWLLPDRPTTQFLYFAF